MSISREKLGELTIGDWLKRLTPAQAWGILVALTLLVSATFKIGYDVGKLNKAAFPEVTSEPEGSSEFVEPDSAAHRSETLAPRAGLTLEIRTNVNATNHNLLLDSLRQSRGLRALDVRESGQSLNKTPRPTFGFVFYSDVTLYKGDFKGLERSARADWNQSAYSFEVHLPATRTCYLVGFASSSDALRAHHLDGNTEFAVTLYPFYWTFTDAIFSVPFDRIESINERMLTLQPGTVITVFDLVLR